MDLGRADGARSAEPSEPYLTVTDWWLEHLSIKEREGEEASGAAASSAAQGRKNGGASASGGGGAGAASSSSGELALLR